MVDFASPRWQPFTQTAEELSGTFVRAPGAAETEHRGESQSPGFGLVGKDSESVFTLSFGHVESFLKISNYSVLLQLLTTHYLFPAQVLRQDSSGVQICAHQRTEMNHLDVALRSFAPTAVQPLVFAATWEKRQNNYYKEKRADGILVGEEKNSSIEIRSWQIRDIRTPLSSDDILPPLSLLRFHDAEVKADSASRTGRERRQVRFGVSGCAERPEPVDQDGTCLWRARVMRTHMPRTKRH